MRPVDAIIVADRERTLLACSSHRRARSSLRVAFGAWLRPYGCIVVVCSAGGDALRCREPRMVLAIRLCSLRVLRCSVFGAGVLVCYRSSASLYRGTAGTLQAVRSGSKNSRLTSVQAKPCSVVGAIWRCAAGAHDLLFVQTRASIEHPFAGSPAFAILLWRARGAGGRREALWSC